MTMMKLGNLGLGALAAAALAATEPLQALGHAMRPRGKSIAAAPRYSMERQWMGKAPMVDFPTSRRAKVKAARKQNLAMLRQRHG